MDLGMFSQKLRRLLGLMGREVVGDHVDLPTARLVGHDVGEEGNELCRGVPPGRLARHLTGLGMKAA